MKLTKHEIEQLNQIAGLLSRVGKVIDSGGPVRLTRHDKEEGIRIRAWGRIARSGVGLGYGRSTLDDGRRDGAGVELTPYEFDRVHRAVLDLPSMNQAVIVLTYRDEMTSSEIGGRMVIGRTTVDNYRDEGLSILYGQLCHRITTGAEYC